MGKNYLDNDNHGKWKLFFDSELHDFGGAVIFKGNLNKNYLAKFIHISDAFTTEILKICSEISYDDNIFLSVILPIRWLLCSSTFCCKTSLKISSPQDTGRLSLDI